MHREQISLTTPLPVGRQHELRKRIFFVSDEIVDFELDIENGFIQAIDVTTSQPVESTELAAKIDRVIAADIIGQKTIPQKVIWRSGATPSYQTDIFEQLLQKNLAFEMGEGQVAFGEPLMKLMDYFDDRLREIAVSRLNAQEYRYPTLVSSTTLEKTGYFDSFPHFLMFVTRLHNDIETYQDFLEAYRAKNDIGAYALSYCRNFDYCLPPTMCFHTYHQFSDRQLGGENLVVTSRGKSFRFESRYHRTLERLWDFTIREIVFLGTRDFVLDCRETFMDAAIALVEELGLAGYCEVANDPFFCSQDTAAKILSQKMLELKYELRLQMTADSSLAIGSFNFHEHFFGERFNIKKEEDDWIQTGCVGFGLERFVYAFLCQYGLDEAQWPQPVRRIM